jgi:hypothetical protein
VHQPGSCKASRFYGLDRQEEEEEEGGVNK